MRLMCLILLTCNSLVLFAQKIEIDDKTELYTKQGVIDIENTSKSDIFNKAVEWLTVNYKSAKDVIQLKDNEAGKIIIKGTYSTSLYMKKGWIHHTLVLDFKDNKFRYTYSNFAYYSTGSGEVAFESPMMGRKKALKETEQKTAMF